MNIHFREPANIGELDSLFRLRYSVYSENPLLQKMISLGSPYDINWFDLHAFHFAGFAQEKPIACMRIVTHTETYFASWIKTILAKNNHTLEPGYTQFPFQLYCPHKDWSRKFIEGLKGRRVGEVGKLAIHSGFRKGGRILNELIESFVQYCKEIHKFDTGFGSCTLPLERYYRKFGFERAEGAMPFTYSGLPEAVIVKFDN